MKRILAWLSLWLASPALSADPSYVLSSASDTAEYGVLVVAPVAPCPASRVVVRADGGQWKSATLSPGELAVVRLGNGFAPGDHTMTVTVLGCDQPAHAARRVTLAKRSPDHGWRGSALH